MPLQDALNFDRNHWATGSVVDDPFYSVGAEHEHAPPGTLLKLEKTVDVSKYTLPPSTALSRFVYQSEDLSGSPIPVSAYILWPFSPRTASDGYQVVAWSHGTSGISPDCAPSHMMNLWQHYFAPFQLALQGYVVIGTDYAGLGVGKTASGKPTFHPYLASPSQATDVLYSIRAAQSALPELSRYFVVAGHSQGGGSAWACAQKQAVDPIPGYLGAVALSPVTRYFAESEPICSILTTAAIPGIKALFPALDIDAVMTETGKSQLGSVRSLHATMAPALAMLSGVELLKPGWRNDPFIQQYQALATNGGKAISGPLLIVHGENDHLLNMNLLADAVSDTMDKFPEADITFIRVPGVRHNPSMTSAQHIWMDWIAEKFARVRKEGAGLPKVLKPALPVEAYSPDMNWYIEKGSEFYHTP